MVIYHLQEAFLDIIDLNLSREDLKEAISDYLAELLEAGPAYLEAQRCDGARTDNLHFSLVVSSLRQCPPPHRLAVASQKNLGPYQGAAADGYGCRSLSAYQPPPEMRRSPCGGGPKSVLSTAPATPIQRQQSEPVTRALQQPYADDAQTPRSAESSALRNERCLRSEPSVQSSPATSSGVRRNLFADECASCHRSGVEDGANCASVESDASKMEGGCVEMSAYIGDFEHYIQSKYSVAGLGGGSAADLDDSRQPLPGGPPMEVVGERLPHIGPGSAAMSEGNGARREASDDDGELLNCPLSRFELFLRETGASVRTHSDVGHCPCRGTSCERRTDDAASDRELAACEIDETFGTGEKLTENQRKMLRSRFEKFMYDSEVGQENGHLSGNSMNEEEFYRELLRIDRSNNKSC